MKSGLIGVVVTLAIGILFAWEPSHAGVLVDELQYRGDVNGDGSINISDPTKLGNYLYAGGEQPPCLATCDANGDGSVNGSDQMYLFNYLFSGGPAPYGVVVCD